MSFLPYAYLAAYSYAAGQKSISADEGSSLQKWSIVVILNLLLCYPMDDWYATDNLKHPHFFIGL